VRFLSLGILLFAFWLLLSGHYQTLLIVLGLVSVGICLYLAKRMQITDYEGHPIHLAAGAITYIPWLVLEIIKSTIDVTKIVLSPSLPISPTMIKIIATQKTHLGVNIYGNSITLTPGTITVEAQGQELMVHALTQAGANDLKTGDMDRRATAFEAEETN